MKTRALAIFFAVVMLGFAGTFIWAALRPTAPLQMISDGGSPIASVSETLSDGRIDVLVYALGGRDIRLEIRFVPDTNLAGVAVMRPDVNFAMVNMHMDGLSPPLENVEAGIWQVNLKLPMAGRWMVSSGFGEEFAEVEFDAR